MNGTIKNKLPSFFFKAILQAFAGLVVLPCPAGSKSAFRKGQAEIGSAVWRKAVYWKSANHVDVYVGIYVHK